MGNTKSSLPLTQEDIMEISSETGFTAGQIEQLWSRFTSLDKWQKGFLSREDFLRIPGASFNSTGISSQIRTKLCDWAIWQARACCYSQAALSSNDSKTL